MTKMIFDAFIYTFETVFVLYYAQTLFKAKFKLLPTFIALASAEAILYATHFLFITYLNLLLMVSFEFLFFKLFYENSAKTAVFHALILVVTMFAAEMIVLSINSVNKDFNVFEKDDSAYIYLAGASKLIYFVILLVFVKILSNRKNREKHDKYFWLLLIIPFSSILVFTVFRYITYQTELTKPASRFWLVACILTLASDIMVFFIYEYSVKNTAELYELKAFYQKQEYDEKYFELIKQSNNEMSDLSKSMQEHLNRIKQLENTKQVRGYIDELLPDIEKFSKTGLSKNKMFDLILSKYQKICDKKEIILNIDVKTSNLKFIDDVDLSTLLNNLLDNAVEAAEISKAKKISVIAFEKNKQYDGLIIKNSCDKAPENVNGVLKTTKPNEKMHGIGISSVIKTLKKYNAVYDWKYDEENHSFETDIAFCKL